MYALHPPHLNQQHREYTLTALFPTDAAQRQRLKAYMEGAETLQMLNRGRQTRVKHGAKPKAVLAMHPDAAVKLLAPFATRVRLSAYEPLLPFTRSSNNPRWRAAMLALCQELLPHFPHGLPRALLEALPPHAGTNAKQGVIQQRLEALASTLPATSQLHQAFCTPGIWPHRNVPTGGNGNDRDLETEVMTALGLQSVQVRGQGRPVVYVRDPADAGPAYLGFTTWLKSK